MVQAQFTYTTTDGTITITGYTGSGGALVIPPTINGLTVSSIGDSAFYRCPLTSVTIPKSVTNIGAGAFYGCASLTAITVDALNSFYSSLKGVLFDKTQTTLIGYPDGKAGGSYTVPDGVTSIGEGAFAFCDNLTNVTIPNSVTSIGDVAFAWCEGLGSVTIPDSVASIGASVFLGCYILTNVTIGNSVTSIGPEAFDYCGSLTSVTFPNSVTSIGDGAFEYCYSLTSVYFQGNAPSLGAGVFVGFGFGPSDPATIYYSAGTTGWGTTFGGRPSFLWDPLSQATYTANYGAVTITGYAGPGGAWTIPSTIDGYPVTSIGVAAFYECSSLTSVTIPDSVTSIGDWAFRDCTSLTNVTIPNSVATIADDAFCDCAGLTGVYFGGNAPIVGSNVFLGDNNATVYYVAGTTGWGATFAGCPTKLALPPSIVTPPSTQTAELGSLAGFSVEITDIPPPATYQWYFNGSNALGSATNSYLDLANVQPAQAGAYTAVVTNLAGAVTSAPALLSVIPPVERSIVPALNLAGDVGSFLHLDYANGLGPGAQWLSLTNLTLTSTPQLCFDLSEPLPAQRFYRAWQTNAPSARPVLDMRLAIEIPLTGAIGSSVQIDYIDQFGPTDAWVTLDTVLLTNTTQLYFDLTMFRQPARLYRLVAVP